MVNIICSPVICLLAQEADSINALNLTSKQSILSFPKAACIKRHEWETNFEKHNNFGFNIITVINHLYVSYCHFPGSENDCLLLRPLPLFSARFFNFFFLQLVFFFFSFKDTLLFSFRFHHLQFLRAHTHEHRKSTCLATDKRIVTSES